MAETTRADLYAPEVWGDLAQAEFAGRTILGTAATTDDTLVGVPGDVIKFPKWNALGEMEDLQELVPIETEKLSQSATEARIKEAGEAVEISDTAQLVGLGNAQDEAIRQFGILTARKLDADLYQSAIATYVGGRTFSDGTPAVDSAPLTFTATGGIGWGNLVDASGVFEDEWEPSDFAGLFINSAERGKIFKDPDFIASQPELMTRGLIGNVGGLNVRVTNRIPAGRSLLIKNGALSIKYKRRPIVETDRDILKRADVYTTNVHYGTHRTNDSGVLVINWGV